MATEKAKTWWSADGQWFCVLADDGVNKATISLTPKEATALGNAALASQPATSKEDAALAPCPFCGGQPKRAFDSDGAWTQIVCDGCGARSHEAFDIGKIVAAWNTRALRRPDAPDAVREALQALLKTASLLYQNAEGCAVNHYGHDFKQQGIPGWLRDCAADISRARQALGGER